jgi:hypothetical protein
MNRVANLKILITINFRVIVWTYPKSLLSMGRSVKVEEEQQTPKTLLAYA